MRQKLLISVLLAGTLTLNLVDIVTASKFQDVPAGNEHSAAIDYLVGHIWRGGASTKIADALAAEKSRIRKLRG